MKIILSPLVPIKEIEIGGWYKSLGNYCLKVSETLSFTQNELFEHNLNSAVERLEHDYVHQGPQFKEANVGDFIYAYGDLYVKLNERQVFNIRSKTLGVMQEAKQIDLMHFGVKLKGV